MKTLEKAALILSLCFALFIHSLYTARSQSVTGSTSSSGSSAGSSLVCSASACISAASGVGYVRSSTQTWIGSDSLTVNNLSAIDSLVVTPISGANDVAMHLSSGHNSQTHIYMGDTTTQLGSINYNNNTDVLTLTNNSKSVSLDSNGVTTLPGAVYDGIVTSTQAAGSAGTLVSAICPANTFAMSGGCSCTGGVAVTSVINIPHALVAGTSGTMPTQWDCQQSGGTGGACAAFAICAQLRN